MILKVQFNKEFMLKHRFWVLLGLAVPCTLFGILTLVTKVAADIATKREAVKTKLKQVESPPNQAELRNQKMVDEKGKEASALQEKEGEVWKLAWGAQGNIYRWPIQLEREFEMTTGRHAWELKIDRAKKDWNDFKDIPDVPEKNLIHVKVKKTTKDFILAVGRPTEKDPGKEYKIYRTGKNKITVDGKDFPPGAWGNQISDGSRGQPADIVAVTYEHGLFFGDPLTDSQQNRYSEVYHEQLLPVLAQVDPINDRGKGVVQLRGWPYSEKPESPPPTGRFFHFQPNAWKVDKDISEEAWIAQEDLWIQEEIFRLIRVANDYVSDFEPNFIRQKKQKEAEIKNKKHTFENPYWKLTLTWPGDNTLKVLVENKLHRRQKLDFNFLVQMSLNDAFPPDKFQILGEPLNPKGLKGDSREQEVKLDSGPTRTGIYRVQQALTWETAAVRRVDSVNFGKLGEGNAQGNRIFPDDLRAYKKEEGADKGGEKAATDGKPPIGIDLSGGNQGPKTTYNGLIRERYLADGVTTQLRRLPVAVCLIVEQEHVDRVQAAFNNSRLRFLTAQVLLNRNPGSVRPHVGETPESETPVRPTRPAGGDKGDGPVRPSTGPQPASGGGGGGNDDLETNVELVIYGIMTIYERFPPRVYTPAADAK